MPNTRTFKPQTAPATVDVSDVTDVTAEEQSQPQSRPNNGYSSNRSYEPRQAERDLPTESVTGYLDLMPDGHGFLRPKYTPSEKDVYISASQIRRLNLRPGDFVEGGARLPK